MQVAFDALGCRQPGQQPATPFVGQPGVGLNAFQALLDPAFFRGFADVHVFRTNRFAIGAVESEQDLPEAGLARANQRAGMEYRVEVGLGEVVIVEFEIGYGFRLLALQRVRAGVLVATETVGIDQLQHPDLLVFKVQSRIGQACDALAAQMTGEAGKLFPDIGMGNVGG
jgi:hypothetical protein